jgi:DNA polymerase-3 subunit epsilon
MDIHSTPIERPDGILAAPLAIVDLETTGAHPAWDRVTEIAVLEVEDGEITAEWSTLVNPETPIPAAIQALTGITNAMVADAPRFAALADALHARLAGRVFVAHNARFDYGFLRHEFERSGIRFDAKTLCTVRLSRRLYPDHARHNLDSLIARHGLDCQARHRALGDAEAVWQFLCRARQEHGDAVVGTAARLIAKQPSLPAQLSRDAVDAVPEAPGVYLFYGEREVPLYVGKGVAMRSRVLSHFADNLRSAKEMQLAREVRRIEFERTAGELGALLREAQLVKQLAPVFNRQLRRANDLCGFVLEARTDAPGHPATALRLVGASELDAALVAELRGVFRSKRAALAALRGLADLHGLCLQTLGFEPARGAQGTHGACFRHQIARCAGVCAGREPLAAHQARLRTALAQLKSLAWPWQGPIGIVERSTKSKIKKGSDPASGSDPTEVQIVHLWCWLGTARSQHEVAAVLEQARRPQFDLDHYRILERHLANGKAHVVELAVAPCT